VSEKFIALLEDVATVLGTFSESPPVGASTLVWDGTAYVPAAEAEDRPFDPSAAKWWATFITVVALLAGQSCPLSEKQREYLNRLLFGGMGSFNDFWLDEELGSAAVKANQRLERLRDRLFNEFKAM
jgi:hypothetical protein